MKNTSVKNSAATALAALVMCACSGNQESEEAGAGRTTTSGDEVIDDQGRCEVDPRSNEVSEYDTSGDAAPDVRRVYRRLGDPPLTRLVLTCRESDLNGDGIKDVVRYYNDEGRPQREEADINFDGVMDLVTVFQEGRVVRTERDTNADGRIDTKIFYDDRGAPLRTEKDNAGRSVGDDWHPDTWEYYEDGHLVRIGTDIDGDGRVDRWERDEERAPRPGDADSQEGAGQSAEVES